MINKLHQGINKLYRQVIKPSKSETILILGDNSHNSQIVSQALFDIGSFFTPHVNLIIHQPKLIGQTKEKPVISALKSEPDIFFITNLYRDGDENTNETWYPRKLQLEKKSRGFWFKVNSLPEFTQAINIDYQRLTKDSQTIALYLKKAIKIHIADKNGTNLTIDISDPKRLPVADCDGTQNKAGSGLNIPMGEVLISPIMTKTTGVAYIDREYFDEFTVKTIKIDQPIKITFKNGLIDQIDGGKAANLFREIINQAEKMVPKNKPEQKSNCRSVSEFAIGINKEICNHGKTPIYDLLFDEKIAGTAHIAFGSSYDGDNAPFHSDLIFSQPKITAIFKNGSKKILCQNGQLMI